MSMACTERTPCCASCTGQREHAAWTPTPDVAMFGRTLAPHYGTIGCSSRQTLRHDSKDRVVAADTRAVFLVVLLGMADLEELRLPEATVTSKPPGKRQVLPPQSLPLSRPRVQESDPLDTLDHLMAFISFLFVSKVYSPH